MTGGNDQSSAGSLAFKDGVGSCCGTMVNKLENTGPAKLSLEDTAGFGDAILDTDALVGNRGWDFGTHGLPVQRENVDVGEGATNVDVGQADNLDLPALP